MARLVNEQGVGWRLFARADDRWRSVRLGACSQRIAEEIRRRVEALESCRRFALPVDASTLAWVAALPDDMHARIARLGLVESRSAVTVGQWIERAASGSGKRPHTVRNDAQAVRACLSLIDPARPLSSVTEADAVAVRDALSGRFAQATWARHLKRIRSWFASAERAKIIESNPFAGVRCPASTNPARKAFIDRDTFARVVDATDDPHWRLVLALARYGGLRVPSEVLGLHWSDIDWRANTIRVRQHKTRERTMPLFPELRPFLEAMPRTGSDHVVTRARASAPNWRGHVLPIVARSGVRAWPKLFHNLRASRETELCQSFPLHVVASWLGNSPEVATTHYLTVTPADFAAAVA
jgi:integrase